MNAPPAAAFGRFDTDIEMNRPTELSGAGTRLAHRCSRAATEHDSSSPGRCGSSIAERRRRSVPDPSKGPPQLCADELLGGDLVTRRPGPQALSGDQRGTGLRAAS